MNDEVTHYKTVKQIIEGGKYPLKLGQLRQLLFRREQNGLSIAVKKMGKTLLIHEGRFAAWIQKQITQANR